MGTDRERAWQQGGDGIGMERDEENESMVNTEGSEKWKRERKGTAEREWNG